MNNKEKKFRALLKKAEEEYFETRASQPVDEKKIVSFVKEMETVELVGDELIWLN